jgi:hypothetical protein
MNQGLLAVLLMGLALMAGAAVRLAPPVEGRAVPAAESSPAYEKDGSLVGPKDYREWIFLSSGMDMVYGPRGAMAMGHSMFDNVFVNAAAYRSFLRDGTWPDKTVLVLEIRGAETHASINHGGNSQSGEVMGLEVHVKDEARFPGKWAFFDVSLPGNAIAGKATLIPQTADCYRCHAEHAAVDTTFAQFYPTLLPLAKDKGTLSAAYRKESAAAK